MAVHSELLQITPAEKLARPVVTGTLETIILNDPETDVVHAIDTYGVDGRTGDSKKTMIVFQPWSDYVGREFAQQRMDIIAEATQSRVIGVDNLGVGLNTTDIPFGMRGDIARGDFSKVSKFQWEAVMSNGLFDESDELTLAYYSLGTTMAASMAAQTPEGLSIDRMILWECAAIEPQKVGRLALTYFVDGPKNWKNYMAENPDWVAKPSSLVHLAKQIIRQPAGHVVYPMGMARKTVYDDLSIAYERGAIRPDSGIFIINGTDSKVSPTVANDRFAEAVSNFPIDRVDRVTHIAETHSVNDSFRRIYPVFSDITRR